MSDQPILAGPLSPDLVLAFELARILEEIGHAFDRHVHAAPEDPRDQALAAELQPVYVRAAGLAAQLAARVDLAVRLALQAEIAHRAIHGPGVIM